MGGRRWLPVTLAAVVVCLLVPHTGAASVVPPAWAKALMGKIKHIIVLMEENRSFDHFFGFAAKKLGVNGLTGNEFNYINLSNPSQGKVPVSQTGRYINPCDPDHGTPATAAKMQDSMGGFVSYEQGKGHGTEALNWCDVMSVFDTEKIPIITTLSQEYALMDRMFCSHPGPTWPNRLYALTASSNGMTSTGVWYQNQPGKLFPQRTFFDQVEDAGMTWKNYYNDTPWELFVDKIAHTPENVAPLTQLFEDAAAGTLPNYAWINPRCGMNVTTGQGSNDQHPDHDVSLGEALMKDIYESLRASPQWNETLFIITYDEHGGFYDHVPPPNAPAPDDVEPPSYPDPGFNFSRLGVRIPTVLISPWIEKGTVLSAPPAAQRPAADSEYDLTSIMATARKLLGMPSDPLTKRDAWSGTFEHLISRAEPRTDCPAHLPDVPSPDLSASTEAALPLNDLQKHISEVHAHVVGGPDAASEARALASRQQAHVSEWVQKRYKSHADNTMAWRRSKRVSAAARDPVADPEFTIMTRPPSMSGWKAMFSITFTSNTTGTATATLSASVDKTAPPVCLEWQNATTAVGYSNCYPSAAPETNRDPDQLWVASPDATIRPAAHRDMCLTNVPVQQATFATWGLYNVSVAPCDGSVEQHWGVGVVNPTDKVSSITFATEESIGLI